MASSPPVFMPVPQTILYKTVTPMLAMGTQQVLYIQQAAPQPQLLVSQGTLGSCSPVFVQQLPANQLRALESQRPIAVQLSEPTPRLREVSEDVPSPRGELQEVGEVKEEEEEPVKENPNGQKEEEEEEEEAEENLTGKKDKKLKDEEDLQKNVTEQKEEEEEEKKTEQEERGTGHAGSPGGDALRTPVSRMQVPRVRLFRLPVEFPSDGPLPQFRIVTLPNDPRWILEQITEEPDTGTGSLVTKGVPGQDSSSRQLPSRSARRPPVGSHERCAVCRTQDRLVLCAECRTGFHRHCHVPPIPKTKRAQWQCMLCRDLSDVGDHYSGEFPGKHTCLAVPDQRKCEHLLLVLMCNTHSSALHRKPQVSPRSCNYIDVALIRGRLLRRLSPPYRTPAEFVSDIWLLLGNLVASSEDPRSVRELQGCFRRKLSEVFGNSLHPKLMRPPSYWEREEGEREGEQQQQQQQQQQEEERGRGGAQEEEEERGRGGAQEEEEERGRGRAQEEEERGRGGAQEEEEGRRGGAQDEVSGGGGAKAEEGRGKKRRGVAQEKEGRGQKRGRGGAKEKEGRRQKRGRGGAQEEEGQERGRGGAQEKERGRDGPQEEEEEEKEGRGVPQEKGQEEERGRGGAEEEAEERGRGGAQEKEQEGGGTQAEEGQEQEEEEGRGQKTGRGGAQEVGGAAEKQKEVGPKKKVKMVRVVRMEGEENGPPVKRLRLTMIVR